MSYGGAYPPPPPPGRGGRGGSNYGNMNPAKRPKTQDSSAPSYATSYENKGGNSSNSGYGYGDYSGYDYTSDYTGGQGYYTSSGDGSSNTGAAGSYYGQSESYGEEYGSNEGYGSSEGYSAGQGYGSNEAHGSNKGYGSNEGYGSNKNFGSYDGYNMNEGYDSNQGYGEGDGYGSSGGYGQSNVGAGRGSFNNSNRGASASRGYGGGTERGRGNSQSRGNDRGRGSFQSRGSDRGRGTFRGRGGGGGAPQPRPRMIKPKPTTLSAEQKQKIENNNMKQLVAPKPPHRILNEMMGGGVRFEYTENPPLQPGVVAAESMHTLVTTIDGDKSSGTGPSHDIAKNICSEHAIMGVVTRRYKAINDMAAQNIKSKEELMLEDETPFELASVAIFKMLNEWEAKGFELPQDLEDILYTSHLYLPVKQRLNWIRGSNLGFSTPIQGGPSGGIRKRPMRMPNESVIEQKNPVSFLNEIRGTVDYIELGSWGSATNMSYSIGANIDGVPYSGTGPTKKDAKRNCAIDILTRLYRIQVPNN